MFVIGLNPSTATQHRSDTTIAKVEEVARRAGFDGFAMLNLYPVRATDFNTLPCEPDAAIAKRNLAVIERVVSQQRNPVVWAAWGTSILQRAFFVSAASQLAARLRRHRPEWRHFGPLTVDGHPRHPSRLDYSWRFSTFEVDAYVERMW